MLQQSLLAALHSLGAVVQRGVRVEDVDAEGHVTVRRLADDMLHGIASDTVVVAAGSWCNVGLAGVLSHLPMRPVKGQVLHLGAAALLRRVVRTPDIYLIPHTQTGQLIVGASVEEQGFDIVPSAGATFDLLRHAWRVLPGIYDAPLQEIAVGFRPAVRDHRPVIGRWQQSRVLAATGHYRNGILQAPGTARLLADLLCDGVEHELLRCFTPNRFAVQGAAARPVAARGEA
jgi:glycine oxidase